MSDYSAASYKSSAELEREVEAQRHRVSNTIDEIQNKMSPGQLLDGVMDYTKGGSVEFAQNLGRSIKDNPLPVALVGAGLLWLMTGSGNHRSQGDGYARSAGYQPGDSDAWRSDAYASGSDGGLADKAKQFGEDVSESVGGAMSGLAGAVDEATHGVSHAAKDMIGQMQRQAPKLAHVYDDQPLLGGALAFALGAAIGAALPHTRQEDEMLGKSADDLKREAIAKTGDLFEEGKEAVEQRYAEIKNKVGGAIDEAGKAQSEPAAMPYQG
jgi:hypothetical protein